MDNKKFQEKVNRALNDRVRWEQKLARCHLQRFCLDRPTIQNHPWPKASNVRYPLSDTLIAQKVPFVYRVFYSSENLPFFKAMKGQNVPYAAKTASYYDFLIKQKTELEEELLYQLNSRYQDGEHFIKVMWDIEKQVPTFEHVDNLFIITPSSTQKIEDAEWIVHVIQMTELEMKKKFKDVPGIEDFIKKVKDITADKNDQLQREQTEYEREGINRSIQDGSIVLHECHYQDDNGIKRIKTMSPDDCDFDFQDDKEYPYGPVNELGIVDSSKSRWMIFHGRLEVTDKRLHSSRGICELVQEGEYSLTAMQRAKHNAMTLYNAPMYSAPNGIPGSSQNWQQTPGEILPFALQIVQQGQPPISWDIEMNQTRAIWERRVATPDFGLGKANTQNDSRTATEIKAIGGQQGLNVEMEVGLLKKFLNDVLRYGWSLVVQFKPKSLEFYFQDQLETLPMEALNNDYIITCSGSAESVNREYMAQKAIALRQTLMGDPSANMEELTKNVIERLEPDQVTRFFQSTGLSNMRAQRRAVDDLVVMMAGFPVQADPSDNHIVSAMTDLQFLDAAKQKGTPLTPQQVNLISQNLAQHREALKKTNKPAYEQLNQALNQIDMHNQQQASQPQPAQPVAQGPQQASVQQNITALAPQ